MSFDLLCLLLLFVLPVALIALLCWSYSAGEKKRWRNHG